MRTKLFFSTILFLILGNVIYINTYGQCKFPSQVNVNGSINLDTSRFDICPGQYALKVADLDPEAELKLEVIEPDTHSDGFMTTKISTVTNNDLIKVNLKEDKHYNFYDPLASDTKFNLHVIKIN